MSTINEGAVDYDKEEVKFFGKTRPKGKYKGKNPAGIPVGRKSITRWTQDGNEIKMVHSKKHGGAEGEHFRGRRKVTVEKGPSEGYKWVKKYSGTKNLKIKKKKKSS